ncbi:hypothetical protein F2Q70_00003641 [Brassica cretica]|uniref:Uncharacterized protein n=1 Tax=Brassica cretica TaxID=69181 RepID=A0A8S9J3J6_BRACR|nr:hypothetical protein F2Q70_00003641 [Brassica cretica]
MTRGLNFAYKSGTRKLRKNQPSTKINHCNNGRLRHSRTNGRVYATDATADAIDARVTTNNRSAATDCTAGTTCPNWKIDDLAAKVDLLLKNNQNHIYVMEETNLEPGTTDAAAETETSEEDQQEISRKSVPKHWISEAILPESESES